MNQDNPWVGVFMRWLTQNRLRDKCPQDFFKYLENVATYRSLGMPCGPYVSDKWLEFTMPYMEMRFHLFLHMVYMPVLYRCGFLTKKDKPILLKVLNDVWKKYLTISERFRMLSERLQTTLNKSIEVGVYNMLDLHFRRIVFYDFALMRDELNSHYVKRKKN